MTKAKYFDLNSYTANRSAMSDMMMQTKENVPEPPNDVERFFNDLHNFIENHDVVSVVATMFISTGANMPGSILSSGMLTASQYMVINREDK